MKKFFAVIVSGAAAAAALCGCAVETDYCRFISEKRYDSYLYEDDDLRIKIDFSERETPYLSDGYCGDMQKICEIFVKFTESPASVEAKLGESGGEMNYMSVTDSFYLSFTGEPAGDSAEITLTYGGEERVFTAESVLYDGVMTCEDALECVTQYDEGLFETLTDGKIGTMTHVTLPLNGTSLETTYTFHFTTISRDTVIIYEYLPDGSMTTRDTVITVPHEYADEVVVNYTAQQQFTSMDCGLVYSFDLETGRHSTNFIKSMVVVNTRISEENEDNIYMFF